MNLIELDIKFIKVNFIITYNADSHLTFQILQYIAFLQCALQPYLSGTKIRVIVWVRTINYVLVICRVHVKTMLKIMNFTFFEVF